MATLITDAQDPYLAILQMESEVNFQSRAEVLIGKMGETAQKALKGNISHTLSSERDTAIDSYEAKRGDLVLRVTSEISPLISSLYEYKAELFKAGTSGRESPLLSIKGTVGAQMDWENLADFAKELFIQVKSKFEGRTKGTKHNAAHNPRFDGLASEVSRKHFGGLSAGEQSLAWEEFKMDFLRGT